MPFTMYVDESNTQLNLASINFSSENSSLMYPQKFITVSGIVIDDNNEQVINDEMNKYKKSTFRNSDIVLHSTDIGAFKDLTDTSKIDAILKKYPEYSVFRDENTHKSYNREIKRIFNTLGPENLKIISSTTNYYKFKKIYNAKGTNSSNLVYKKCFEDIVSNFAWFLKKNNDTGKIIFENSSQKSMYIRSLAAMMICGKNFCESEDFSKIENLLFLEKNKNNSCLQLVDFVPNVIGNRNSIQYKRILSERIKNKKDAEQIQKNADQENKKFSEYNYIKSFYYDGGVKKSNIFGNLLWTGF